MSESTGAARGRFEFRDLDRGAQLHTIYADLRDALTALERERGVAVVDQDYV